METSTKQVKNLHKQLINDGKGVVFFASNKINKTLLNKAKKSAYEKDRLFYNFYINLEHENVLYKDRRGNIPFYTPFIEQKKGH